MEVSLTPEQESLLAGLAARTGRSREEILREAVDAFLGHESWFAKAVEQGREAARKGDFLEHGEVVSRLEQRYRS